MPITAGSFSGDTLDVLYNEASGTVQVELVATPTRTTYDWDVGSGTWSASTAAGWSPPGNSTTPSSNSNVTIGTGKGGTVTLAEDQTINSLTLTSGYTAFRRHPFDHDQCGCFGRVGRRVVA